MDLRGMGGSSDEIEVRSQALRYLAWAATESGCRQNYRRQS